MQQRVRDYKDCSCESGREPIFFVPGTSTHEDEAFLETFRKRGTASSTAAAKERAAVAFRLEKKRVLIACLKNLGVDYEVVTSGMRKGEKKVGGTGKGFA
jgi:hypothetical protein